MNILFEKEVCHFLEIPSIPLKKWDGMESFKYGVAVTRLALGNYAYAVCTFDAEEDKEPRVVKSFAHEPFYGLENIFIVPSFMETNVEEMDLDEASKAAAERLAQEAHEIADENKDEVEEKMDDMEKLSEWIFPEITNMEEALAWLKNYNITNGIKGRLPQNEETMKLRLLNIYSQLKNK